MKYVYKEEDNGEWHKMFEVMPPTTTGKVEFLRPNGDIDVGEFFVDMAGWYMWAYGSSGDRNAGDAYWGSLEHYTHWRYCK